MKVNIKLKTLKEDVLHENLPCNSCHIMEGHIQIWFTTEQKHHFEKIKAKDIELLGHVDTIKQHFNTTDWYIIIPTSKIVYIKTSF